MAFNTESVVGRTWSEADNLDWDGWYPVVRQSDDIIIDVIPAAPDTAEEIEKANRYKFDEGREIYLAD